MLSKNNLFHSIVLLGFLVCCFAFVSCKSPSNGVNKEEFAAYKQEIATLIDLKIADLKKEFEDSNSAKISEKTKDKIEKILYLSVDKVDDIKEILTSLGHKTTENLLDVTQDTVEKIVEELACLKQKVSQKNN